MNDETRLVRSLHVGGYPNLGGGIIVKFLFTDEHTELVVFHSELVFTLIEHINWSISDKSYRRQERQPMAEMCRDTQPAIEEEDYDRVDYNHQVKTWTWDVFDDHISVAIEFATRSRGTFVLPAEACFLLKDYIDTLIDSCFLVDLRTFAKLPLEEMETDLIKSEGYQLFLRLEHFELSVDLFQKNYDELIRHLNECYGRITNPDLIVYIRRHTQDIYMYETLRRFHNFLAACSSLVDHSRNLYREIYEEKELFPEYQKEVDNVFKNDPLSQFVGDLRQFLLHYRLPAVSFTTYVLEMKGAIMLHKNDLELFSGWRKRSKEYLAAQEEEIDLRKVVGEYYEKVTALQGWFQRRQKEIQGAEFALAEKKRIHIQRRRSEEVVQELRKNLEAYKRAPTQHKLLELFSGVLTSKDYHGLRDLESEPKEWLKHAVDRVAKEYFVPKELRQELENLE